MNIGFNIIKRSSLPKINLNIHLILKFYWKTNKAQAGKANVEKNKKEWPALPDTSQIREELSKTKMAQTKIEYKQVVPHVSENPL